MHKVVVLMSTFNGEKYIKDQIESILSQKDVDVNLIVRDDGSSDSTLDILEDYSQQGKCYYYHNDNKGAALSFIDLLFHAPEAEYYSFSDQDDVWLPDKLRIAIEAIKEYKKPALYHGLAGKVDENLMPLPNPQYNPMQTFAGSLLTSATGCTMVFNSALMDILRTYQPKNISMHDAWVYRTCYAVGGAVIYDCNSYMLYRQHSNNVSGGNMSFSEKLNRQLNKNKNLRWMTANELKSGYYCYLPDENKKILDVFVGYRSSLKNKMKIIFGKDFVANKKKTTIQFKILFLLDLI